MQRPLALQARIAELDPSHRTRLDDRGRPATETTQGTAGASRHSFTLCTIDAASSTDPAKDDGDEQIDRGREAVAPPASIGADTA